MLTRNVEGPLWPILVYICVGAWPVMFWTAGIRRPFIAILAGFPGLLFYVFFVGFSAGFLEWLIKNRTILVGETPLESGWRNQGLWTGIPALVFGMLLSLHLLRSL